MTIIDVLGEEMGKQESTLVRIGLIGPVLPYRGGISQHTTMLHRKLRAQADLCTISFKRQYPRYLYPGRGDLDPGYPGYREPGVQYVLDSVNPVTWVHTCRILLAHTPRLIIITWWTFFWSVCFGFIANYFRKRGVQVMFLCHNVIDHESAFWKVALSRRALSQGNTFLVHTTSEEERLHMLVPGARITVHPLPKYHQFPPSKKHLPRRSKLELLFFGFVRPYKGLDILLHALKLLEKEDVFLTIAGEWWGKDTALLSLLDNDVLKAKVEVVDRYLSEQEVADYFFRADIVVLPYRNATGTGVIPLAYHYGKPVIATRVGGLPEFVVEGVSGRLVRPADPEALAEVIYEFIRNDPAYLHEGVKKTAEAMTWEGLGDCILAFTGKNGQ